MLFTIPKQKVPSKIIVRRGTNYTFYVEPAHGTPFAAAEVRPNGDTYQLESVRVLEHMRGYGIGTSLVITVANELDKPLVADVPNDNAGLIAFFTKLLSGA